MQLAITTQCDPIGTASAVTQTIDWCKRNIPNFNSGNISDGYHTFDELYEFRKLYNAALFNEWGKEGDGKGNAKYNVHKSFRHCDGELCFGGGWFIVVAELPTGPISNHYKVNDWDLFKIPQFERSTTPYDGHTPQDVLERLKMMFLVEELSSYGKIEKFIKSVDNIEVKVTTGFDINANNTFKFMREIIDRYPDYKMIQRWVTEENLFDLVLKKA